RRETHELVVVERLTYGYEYADAVGVEASSEDPESARAVLVQPLRVVDDDEQRPSSRRSADERQRPEADEEPIWGCLVAHAERRPEGAGLWGWQVLDAVEERGQELVHSGEAELHLGFDADDAHDVEVGRRRHRGVQEAGLADARLASHQQGSAHPVACPCEEP